MNWIPQNYVKFISFHICMKKFTDIYEKKSFVASQTLVLPMKLTQKLYLTFDKKWKIHRWFFNNW